MWYFSWILGLGLACTVGILNAIWFELLEDQREKGTAPDFGAENPRDGDTG